MTDIQLCLTIDSYLMAMMMIDNDDDGFNNHSDIGDDHDDDRISLSQFNR